MTPQKKLRSIFEIVAMATLGMVWYVDAKNIDKAYDEWRATHGDGLSPHAAWCAAVAWQRKRSSPDVRVARQARAHWREIICLVAAGIERAHPELPPIVKARMAVSIAYKLAGALGPIMLKEGTRK